MDSQSINNIILKVLYLTIILSIVLKNTEKTVAQIPNFLPSINSVNETISPLFSSISIKSPIKVYSNLVKTLNKYFIILILSFIISSIVFFLTYKIIKFVKNIQNNTQCFESINENNLIHNINLKIKKKNQLESENESENKEEINIEYAPEEKIEKDNIALKIEEIIDNFTETKNENSEFDNKGE